MANAVYPLYKQAVLKAEANVDLDGTVKAALIDTGTYTYSALHDFYDDVSTGVVGTPVTLTGVTVSTSGVVDAADVTFTGVSGNTVEAIIIYIDTGTAATSRLVTYLDTGFTGLPVTPNGGDIVIAWNASGIFQL